MAAQLVGIHDGTRILLDKPIMLLGRDEECDIQFDSRKISRRHCCLAQVGDRFIVRDLGSTNGVRINGIRVVEGYLKSGDEITVGNLRYRITWTDEAPEAPRRGSAKASAQPTVRPVAAIDVDDEVLESSDEPIALAEPNRPIKSDSPTQSPAPEIIPDELELASSGDHSRTGPPSARSGS